MLRRKYCYSEAFQRSTDFWIPSLSIFSLQLSWGQERFEMWELNHKESWEPKNWCFWTVVLDKTLESSLDYKEIKPVNPQGNQLWIFICSTDAEAETPLLWQPDAESRLIGKHPDNGKDWRQEEKGTTEDEMVGWHQRFTGREFEQAPGVGDGLGSLACCSPWGHKVRVIWVTDQQKDY